MTELTDLFLKIVNRSISATWLVLAVAALRFLLKKAPKWVSVLLWGLVAVRLVCPFTLESALSLIPSAQTISPEILTDAAPAVSTGIAAANDSISPILSESLAPAPGDSANPLQIWIPIAAMVWLFGIAVLLLYTGISYDRLRRRVKTAIRVKDNLYLSEYVSSPFVLGVFRPKIYLPYHMNERDQTHVLAHERTHIRRRDHWWKPLGFLLLTIHWFNPLMWVAYILLCRDIELACDEKVIQELGTEQRADYSQALLNCSIDRKMVAACPIAFGEVGVKERVKNVLSYKKPAFWVILISMILCIVVAVCFLTDPKTPEQLKWLQTLPEKNVRFIEYYASDAEPSEQYALYDGESLDALVALLSSFEGKAADPSPSDLLECKYTLSVFVYGNAARTIENWDNTYLCIDGCYFEDTQGVLAQDWDSFFDDATYLPADENTTLGVSVTIEEFSPTGITLLFRQKETSNGYVLYGGNDYFLQRKTGDDGWEDLPTRENPTFAEGSYDLLNIRRHKIDWEWLYGTLPTGHYRIGKRVSLNEGGIRYNAGTVYAEFEIDSSQSTPLTITAENVTSTGLDIVYHPADIFTSSDAIAGDYWLEVYQDGQWVVQEPTQEVEPELENRHDRIQTLVTSDRERHYLNWSTNYGELPVGTYRIGIQFTFRDTQTTGNLYAEFTLDGTANTPYSITSTLTADGLSGMAAYQSGGGYVFFDYMEQEIADILNALTVGDFFPSPSVDSNTTITLSNQDTKIILDSDGESVEFSFDNQTAKTIGSAVWATKDSRLLDFFTMMNNYSPENSTYEIYNVAPLADLPQSYTLEEAAIDKVVTIVEGDVRDNQDVWEDFIASVSAKTPATVRILKYYGKTAEYDAVKAICDLEYDGTQYILHGVQDGIAYSLTYQYLRHVTDTIYPIERSFDEYTCYFLTNSKTATVTVKDMDDDRFADPASADQYTPIIVCSDLRTYSAHPQIPTDLTSATLEQDGGIVAKVTDRSTLEKLRTLLSGAEKQTSGERHLLNSLRLILISASSETVTLHIDAESDLCRIGNAYYDYGPGDGVDARETLFALLGISYTDPEALQAIQSAAHREETEADRLRQALALQTVLPSLDN